MRDSAKPGQVSLNGDAAPQSGESDDPIVGWTTSGTARWMIDASGCLTIAPLEGKKSGELEYWRWFFEAPWHDNSSLIISVKIEGAIAILTATGMFAGCSSLTSLDLSGLDASSVTDMSLMFYGCSKLTSLDLSGLDTSKVTNMWRMFYGCLSLRAVKLGESFAFANGTVLRLCSLPRPSGDGCTGLWLSSADGKAYAPKDVPSNVAATYTAQVSQAKVDISGALVSDIPDSVYTGAAIEPAFTVTLGGERLVEGADYMVFYGNNVYAGEATVTVHGIGGYSGEATRTFKILPAAMDRGMVSGVPAEMTATGSQLAPEPVVAFNGERLVEGRGYIVSYGDNVELGAGAGSVTVSAVEDSNFTGSVTVYFDIEKKTEPAPVFPDVDYEE